MAAFEQRLSAYPLYTALFFLTAFAALALLSHIRNLQIAGIRALDFEDAGDPVVRTLGLSPE